MRLFDELVTSPLAPPQTEDTRAFLDALDRQRAARGTEGETTVERALRAGLLADRLGFAFAGGYQAALARLLGSSAQRACFCATERGGAHPRQIETRLHEADGVLLLDGVKTYATLAMEAETLVVVASRGVDAGRNRLAVVTVPAARAGIGRRPKAATPFAPEVVHAEVTLEGVRVEAGEVLPGDGYDRYLKPFRTIEDIHVTAALVGYLVGVARRSGFAAEDVERLAGLAAALLPLGEAEASLASTHRVLAGVLAAVDRAVVDLEPAFRLAEPEERARWERDRPLLLVAGSARGQRLTAARRDPA